MTCVTIVWNRAYVYIWSLLCHQLCQVAFKWHCFEGSSLQDWFRRVWSMGMWLRHSILSSLLLWLSSTRYMKIHDTFWKMKYSRAGKKVVMTETWSFLLSFCWFLITKIDYLMKHANGFCLLYLTRLKDQGVDCDFFQFWHPTTTTYFLTREVIFVFRYTVLTLSWYSTSVHLLRLLITAAYQIESTFAGIWCEETSQEETDS